MRFGFGEGSPVSLAGAGVEELDAAEGDAERTVGELPFNLQVQQPLPELILGNLVGRTLAELGQLPDGPQLAMHGPQRHRRQVQIVVHLLVKFSVELLGEDG